MGSEKYRDWFAKIQRRNMTLAVSAKQRVELDQLSMLQALIDQQSSIVLDLSQAKSDHESR